MFVLVLCYSLSMLIKMIDRLLDEEEESRKKLADTNPCLGRRPACLYTRTPTALCAGSCSYTSLKQEMITLSHHIPPLPLGVLSPRAEQRSLCDGGGIEQ